MEILPPSPWRSSTSAGPHQRPRGGPSLTGAVPTCHGSCFVLFLTCFVLFCLCFVFFLSCYVKNILWALIFSLGRIEGKVGPEFGPESSKIREQKTVSLVNAKFSEIFNKNLLNKWQNSRIRENFGAKSGSLQRKGLVPNPVPALPSIKQNATSKLVESPVAMESGEI